MTDIAPSPVQFMNIDWAGRKVSIEYQWIGADRPQTSPLTPLIVFLHEGLGSLAMWKDFPQQLCSATGCQGLVYSRPGYGQSTARAAQEAWDVDFMHRQAHEVLPALLQALDVRHSHASGGQESTFDHPLWLFGHSDGGSIALLYAARFSAQLSGVIVVAPHILVEDLSIASIEDTKASYQTTALRERLARYHNDPDSAFWGWNDIWLHPNFRHWNIAAELTSITCPLLAVQGLEDEYGTLAQIQGIVQQVPHAELCELENCGHSPHRDQADRLLRVAAKFIAQP